MKIETKFNIADTVFYLQDHKVYKGIVRLPIETITNTNLHGKVFTTVYCNIDTGTIPYRKHDMKYLFATKEELIASL